MDYMKYFKRTDIVKIFEEACKTECIHPEKLSCNDCMVRKIFDNIDELPSADVVERKLMNNYISKEEAIDCVISQYCASSDETEEALGNAVEEIKKRPIADVVERKKGKWILHHDSVGNVYWTCSECGFKGDCNHTITNFCNNCGADMREE